MGRTARPAAQTMRLKAPRETTTLKCFRSAPPVGCGLAPSRRFRSPKRVAATRPSLQTRSSRAGTPAAGPRAASPVIGAPRTPGALGTRRPAPIACPYRLSVSVPTAPPAQAGRQPASVQLPASLRTPTPGDKNLVPPMNCCLYRIRRLQPCMVALAVTCDRSLS